MKKRLQENPELAEMGHGDIIAMTPRNDVRLFVFYLSLGLVRICERIILDG